MNNVYNLYVETYTITHLHQIHIWSFTDNSGL